MCNRTLSQFSTVNEDMLEIQKKQFIGQMGLDTPIDTCGL